MELRWTTQSFLAEYDIVYPGITEKLLAILKGSPISCLYLMRPVKKRLWIIYTYGSSHFGDRPRPRYIGKVSDLADPELVALKIPRLHKKAVVL